MLELLPLLILGSVVLGAHVASRRFVRRRLRFTRFVDRPAALGLVAGGAVALAAVPVLALVPPAGLGTAVIVGVGAGSGAGLGARDSRLWPTEPAV